MTTLVINKCVETTDVKFIFVYKWSHALLNYDLYQQKVKVYMYTCLRRNWNNYSIKIEHIIE